MSSESGDHATVTNAVGSPADMEPGDIYQLVFAGGEKAVIDLNKIPSGAEFDLAVMNLAITGNSATVQMSGSLSALVAKDVQTPDAEEWEELSLQEAFDQHLRSLEMVVAEELPQPPSGRMAGKGADRAVAVPAVGATETFRVLGSLSRSGAYVEVTGKVGCVTADAVFYVDTEVERRNPNDLTSADLQTLCQDFQSALVAERALFGEPSDVNGDQHVAVLLTPQVNRLGSSGGGIITGFFFANDLYPRSTSNPVSNGREIVFTLVPDSAGIYGTRIDKTFALGNLIPAVLPHEMQHAISYNLHVVEGKGTPEESWLNEGLAHLAEDLLGYGHENPSRYAVYLQRSQSYPLVGPASPGLAARGGIFLFLRYLYEQHRDGKAFVWDLLHAEQVGVANVEAAYASSDASFDQFADFVLRWSAALLLNDRGITNDPRYRYAAPVTASTGNLQGVCTLCAPDDNRGTTLAGVQRSAYGSQMGLSLGPASVQYFALGNPPGQVAMYGPSSGSFGAVLVRTK